MSNLIASSSAATGTAQSASGPLGQDRIPELPAPQQPHTLVPLAPTDNVLIARIDAKADLSQEEQLPRGADRRAAVYNDLVATAKASQVQALATLEQLKASGEVTSFESMFLPNAILITTASGKDASVRQALAGVANIASVVDNKTWSVPSTMPSTAPAAGARDAAAGAALVGAAAPSIEWGVSKVRAPEAWAAGADGRGVTIGIVDTGFDAAHVGLRDSYRGTAADGSQVHDYNWFDPFERTAVPYDDGEHGTHVAGSAGGRSDTRITGVAPEAKMIAAKAINGEGSNTTAATLLALQFMLAPTKTDGTAPDPTKGADVVNNSWGNEDANDTTFVDSMAALKAAGTFVVNAAGNSGPREGTVRPPGSLPGHFSVAASNRADTIARFSSRGPSKLAPPGELTPNVAAPGEGIVSTLPGGRYGANSGTSMAAPHVTGAIAALLSKHPQATFDQMATALTRTAIDVDKPGPDTASGYGRIDVAAALAHLDAARGAARP